jgi:hypothetical protein
MFELSNIWLGQYGNPVREMLWGYPSLTSFNHFKVMVQRYHNRPGVQEMYFLPMPLSLKTFDSEPKVIYSLSQVRFMVILDPQPLPDKYAPYVLNGNDTLRGSLIDFPIIYEANVAREMVRRFRVKSVILPRAN